MAIRPLTEHREQPAHQGRLSQADASGTVGSIIVGSALRWFLLIDEGRIQDAKYQVFNCADQVPAASLLAEWVLGKTIDQALDMHPAQLAELGQAHRFDLPFQVWAIAALHDALARLDGGKPVIPEFYEPVEVICRCHKVDAETIQAVIDSNGGQADFDLVAQATAAGTGCGSCRRDIEALVDNQPKPDPTAGAKGRIALMKRISLAVAPLEAEAKELGGKLELWDLKDVRVVIRLSGALTEDSPERKGILERLERALKDDVDPVLVLTVAE